jgi:hypothetical protein
LRKEWASSIVHLDDESHRLGDDKDIREYDRRIKEARVASDRLESNLSCQLRRATNFEETMRLSDFSKLFLLCVKLNLRRDGRDTYQEGTAQLVALSILVHVQLALFLTEKDVTCVEVLLIY